MLWRALEAAPCVSAGPLQTGYQGRCPIYELASVERWDISNKNGLEQGSPTWRLPSAHTLQFPSALPAPLAVLAGGEGD